MHVLDFGLNEGGGGGEEGGGRRGERRGNRFDGKATVTILPCFARQIF